MTKKTEPKAPKPAKRVWAWGIKGSNNLIHTITNNEAIANGWRDASYDVRELVENDGS